MSKKTPFVHTHCHTGYSLLDSMVRIPSMIRKAKEDGQTACCITDHGNLAGVVKFTDTCNKYSIKPILGEEFYIAPDSRHRKKYAKGEHSYSHLILLAKTAKGWDNLRTLSTLAYTEGFYRKPRIDHELLSRYAEGLICTSACIGSDTSIHLKAGPNADGDGKVEFDPELAAAKIAWYFSLFGNDFYIELQSHDDAQERVNEWYRSRYPRDRIIATADCHYLNAEDFDTHDTLLCCNTGSSKYDPDRWKFPTDQCWLKTTDEMLERFFEWEVTNTQTLADSVEFELPLRKQFFMPELPEDILFDDTPLLNGKSYIPLLHPEIVFRKKCYMGLAERLLGIPLGYKERLEYEMDVFVKAGFVEYTLILWDLMEYCKKHDIFTGDGRGSGAGSLVLYALGIVNVDPVERDCPFERFINPGRISNFSPPDVDLDFPKSRRGEILEYLRARYGADRVCQIGTYSTFGAAKLVKKLAPVLHLDQGAVNRIAGIIPEGESSLQGAGPAGEPHGISLEEVYEQSPAFKEIIDEMGEQGRQLMHYAHGLRSLGTHASTHASGLIIASRPVSEIIPLMVAKSSSTKEEIVLAQLDMTDVEAFGLIKFDILGLETLDVLASVQEQVRRHEDPSFSFNDIDLDDPKTYELLGSGRTVGIFQASGGGFGRLLQQAKPTTLEDLAVLTSLCRPGPMLAGATEQYLKRRQGLEAVTYDIPELEPILERNFGVLAFQEDIMAIANRLAGFSLAEADELRKVMGKKQIEKMPAYQEKFVSGLEDETGVSRRHGEELWNQLLPMSQYVFNRSHAMAYSMTTAKTGYAKAHYPAYFAAAAMTAEISGTGQGEDLPMLVRDAQSCGCLFLPPDINESESAYTAVDRQIILLGLLSIRGVGPAAVHAILEERALRGPYASAIDLRARTAPRSVNAGHIKALERAGAFGISKLTFEEELDVYGFYLSGHPCARERGEWDALGISTLREVHEDNEKTKGIRYTKYGRKRVFVFRTHTVCCTVTKLIQKKSKKTKKLMLMLDIEDETRDMKMIVNASQLERFGNPEIKKGALLEIQGTKSDPLKWQGYFDPSNLKVIS